MNANQIPYDQLDWLQIAIYFLALPIVAFLGASLGLLGRWRRGGMLWSTNVGLLGGAISCLILAIGLSTLEGESSHVYFNYFERQYRWMMLGMTLCATAACALAAGAAWRILHAPREKQPFAITIGSVMLVQLFAFISMGSFMGLRLYMLQNSDVVRLYETAWSTPGWTFDANNRLAKFDSLSVADDVREEALSANVLKDLAGQKNLAFIHIIDRAPENVDFSPLLQSENTRAIFFDLSSFSPNLLAGLAQSTIRQQGLNGDLSQVDLSAYAKSSSAEIFFLQGTVSPSTIESLQDSQRIKQLSIISAAMIPGAPAVKEWPKSIERLYIFRSVMGDRDLDSLAGHPQLKTLSISDLLLDAKALAALGAIPNLQELELGVGPIEPGGYAPLANLNCSRVELSVLVEEFSAENAQELKNIKGLRALALNASPIKDELLPALAEIESLEVISIASDQVTTQGLMTLASMPKLLRLSIPNTLSVKTFEDELNAKRKAAGLRHVQVMPTAPITPLKTIIVK